MNWLDIVIIVVLALFALVGLRRGLIKAVLILAGLVLGVFLAGRFYAPFADWLPIANESVARIVSFLIILVVVLAAAIVTALLLRRAISAVKLGWADRVFGAFFGFLVGVVICSAVLTLITKYSNIDATVSGSWIASVLLDRFPVLLALLPEEFDAVRGLFQ